MILELHWFKPNKYVPFIPLVWEGYLTYFIMLGLAVFSFFYFDVLKFSSDNIIFFMISIVFIFILFFILSKNTSEEKAIPKIIPRNNFIPRNNMIFRSNLVSKTNVTPNRGFNKK